MQEKIKRYNSFSDFIKTKFNCRVQKVSVDAGFTCPNKDGTKGVGGCTIVIIIHLTPIIVNQLNL